MASFKRPPRTGDDPDRARRREGNDPDRARRREGINEQGLRMVLGQQPVRELIRRHRGAVTEILLDQRNSARTAALARFADDNDISTRLVPRAELDRLSGNAQHQGVVAFGPPLTLTPPEQLLDDPLLLALALDGVVDPHNFGAVIRSAVGLSGAPVIFAENSSAPLTPATFRASAGAIEHASLCRVRSLHGFLGAAVSSGIRVVGLEPQASELLHEVALTGPTIIVIGSEEKGMGRAVRRCCTQLVRLSASGIVQSLNASVAAGVALHQATVSRGITSA